MKKSPADRGIGWLALAAGLAGLLIFLNRILWGDALNHEEAQHALYGMWLWKDIIGLDFGSFIYDTSSQLVWPFLHSWFLAVAFLLFGCSAAAARTLSLIIFLATIALIYFFSREVCGKQGHKIGLMAAGLALTSPLMIQYSALNTLEGLGTFLFLAAAYTYTWAEEHKITAEYILLAFLIGLMLYVNYLYAFLVIPAFFVGTVAKLWPVTSKALRLRHQGEKEALHFVWWAYRKFIVLAMLIFLSGLWFAFSFNRKVILLYQAIFKYAGGVEVTSLWQAILYYPRVIIEQVSFSPVLGLFILLSIFTPFVAARYQWLNKLYSYVWTLLLLLTLVIFAKAPQLLHLIVPFILIIFSAALFYFEEKYFSHDKKLASVLLVIVFLPAILSLPNLFGQYFPVRTTVNMASVISYFKQTVPPGADFALQTNLQRLNADGLQFYFRDWRGKVLVEPDYSQEELFEEAQYLLSVELDEGSPYQTAGDREALLFWNDFLREKEMAGEIILENSHRFDQIGVTAKIFRKK